MKTLNRHAVVLTAKRPFEQWIEEHVGAESGSHVAVYLVDFDDDFTDDRIEPLLRAHWEPLFRHMLADLYEKDWPPISWETFQDWCDARVCAFVMDVGKASLAEI